MIKVLIIGKGNVAYHLHKAFTKLKSVDCEQISSRNLTTIPQADVTIIAVADDAIASVSKHIQTKIVVHTSGTFAMQDLQNSSEKGVFYPLQTFSKTKEVNFKNVPICIEATSPEVEKILIQLAKKISNNVTIITSEQRKYIHLAAVFANNFSNHLFAIASKICEDNNINFDILKPLIAETVEKIQTLPPQKAQTGPASRNDEKTIKKHLHLLHKEDAKIYKILTKSIQNGA